MITERARYAIKALVHLAPRERQMEWVSAASIAEAENIPPRFLEIILVLLRRGGLIVSKTGRSGGHRLGRAPEQISLLEVLRTTDGPVAPLPCLSRTAYRRCDDCRDESLCGTRRLMALSYHATIEALAATTLVQALADDGVPGSAQDWII